MLDSFNPISSFYAFLSKLIFGNTILNSQIHLVHLFPVEGRLAIIGGGNGEILQYIFRYAPGLEILYVEESSSMISLAKRNQPKEQKVTYLHDNSFSLDTFQPNLIFFPFVLDMYHKGQIQKITAKLIPQCQLCTKWFIVDFCKEKISKGGWFNKFRLNMSIIFFRYTTQHGLNYLPDIFGVLENTELKSLEIKPFNSSFLRTEAYITNPK